MGKDELAQGVTGMSVMSRLKNETYIPTYKFLAAKMLYVEILIFDKLHYFSIIVK